jgi:hypothetical protein
VEIAKPPLSRRTGAITFRFLAGKLLLFDIDLLSLSSPARLIVVSSWTTLPTPSLLNSPFGYYLNCSLIASVKRNLPTIPQA